MSASNRNFPPAGNAEGIYTFSHPGFSYVAVLPNRAYGAFTPANDPRPSVRRDQHPVAVAEAANPASMTAPTVVAAAGAVIAAVLLLAAALYFGVVAPSAAATEPTRAVPGATYETSTPMAEWQQGTFPHLYQNNEAWGYAPFSGSTVAEAGSAPTSVCIAYVQATGSRAYTPAGFAAYGNDHGLAAGTVDETAAYLAQAAAAFDLAAEPVEADALALRRVLALGSTVIAVMSGSGSSSPTALVIEGVNEDSALSVLNPASPAHTPEAWSFDDMMQNAGVLLALRAA